MDNFKVGAGVNGRMTDNPKKLGAGDTHHFEEWARKTSLFREWDELKEDVLRHKWFESEKAGHDVGWDRALVRYNLHVRRQPKKKS